MITTSWFLDENDRLLKISHFPLIYCLVKKHFLEYEETTGIDVLGILFFDVLLNSQNLH